VEAGHAQLDRLGQWVDRGLALLLALVFAFTCLALGGVLASTRLFTHSAAAALLVLHLLRIAFLPGAAPLRAPGAAGWLTGAFLVLGLLHVVVLSPVPWLAFGEWLDWCQLAAVVWIVGFRTPSGWPRLILSSALAATALGAVGLGIYQVLSDPLWLPLGRQQVSTFLGRASGCFGAPNSLAGLLLLCLPASLVLTLRRDRPPWQRVLGAYLTLAFGLGLLLTQSRGAWISLALVFLAWPLLAWRGGGLRRLAGVCLVFCLLALGAAAVYQHSWRSRARLDSLATDGGERSRPVLWHSALAEFRSHPLLGIGAGAWPQAFETHRPESLQADPQRPHNEYLDTLVSLGLAGFLLSGAALLAFTWPRLFGPRRAGSFLPGLGLGLAAFCLHLMLEFHLRVPSTALAFALCLGFARSDRPRGEAPEPGPRWPALLPAFALTCAFVLMALPRLRAEALRETASRAFRHPETRGLGFTSLEESCETPLRIAVALWPSQAKAHAELSAVLAARWTPVTPGLAREAESEARAALALSELPWESWARLGVALDLQGRWVEAGSCFSEALARAPARTETRYFLAWHFSLRPTTFENARGMVEACLRLDPFHPQAQALRKQLEAQKSLHTRRP